AFSAFTRVFDALWRYAGWPSRHSVEDENRLRHLDAVAGEPTPPRNRLDPAAAGRVEGLPISRVDVARERKALRRTDLDQKQHHGAMAGRRHVGKLREMPRAPLGDGIGKLREPGRAHEMHVLDLE